MTGGAQTFTFTLVEAPEQAGINSFMLRIDRVPVDNQSESQATG